MKPKKKEIKPLNEFEQVQPVTGGNAFEVYTKLRVQDEFNKATMGTQYTDITTVNKKIETEVEKYVKSTVPHWWILLQEQANYFCNQFQWDIDDMNLKSQIITTIRCSFYNGVAGLYFNDVTGNFESVALGEINYDSGGNITSAKYTLANQYLSGINESEKNVFNGTFKIPTTKINNLAVFKWGTEATNAWLRILPYVKKQHFLMEMMTVQSFAYIKKFVYSCMNSEASKAEIESFFNPKNPFLIQAGFDGAALNKFSEINASSSGGAMELLEYYKEYMGIVYSQLGRRQNVDIKKERNVSNEIDASQENFDILFKDTNTQFNIFVTNANEILLRNNKSTIELILDDIVERDDDYVSEISNSDSDNRHTTDN